MIEAVLPLTAVQAGMLFYGLKDGTSGAYFEQFTIDTRGHIDAAAFEGAWASLIERHQALRSAIVWEKLKQPVAVVTKNVRVPISSYDWSGLLPSEQQERLRDLQRSDRERGFDLAHAPLLRLALIRLPDDKQKLLFSFHHIILDGWSVAIVVAELMALYAARLKGVAAPLPPAPQLAAYFDDAKKRDHGAAERFWTEHLRGAAQAAQRGIGRMRADAPSASEDADTAIFSSTRAARPPPESPRRRARSESQSQISCTLLGLSCSRAIPAPSGLFSVLRCQAARRLFLAASAWSACSSTRCRFLIDAWGRSRSLLLRAWSKPN